MKRLGLFFHNLGCLLGRHVSHTQSGECLWCFVRLPGRAIQHPFMEERDQLRAALLKERAYDQHVTECDNCGEEGPCQVGFGIGKQFQKARDAALALPSLLGQDWVSRVTGAEAVEAPAVIGAGAPPSPRTSDRELGGEK